MNKTIIVLFIFYCIFYVRATIIPVGSTQTYTNIVDALNNATDYDILQLDPETFSGIGNYQIDLSNKSITIAGNSSQSTIIDCQNLGRAFFSLSNDTIDLVFQDLTIQNCNANGVNSNISASSVNLTAITGWGGVFTLIANTTSVQFINVNFIANYASQGGVLYIMSNESVSIESCYFYGNNATQGGALFLLDVPSVTINNTDFINNRANQSAGAIWASETTFTITDCDFIGNVVSQGDGGANAFLDNSQVHINGCNFLNNTCNNDGGALYLNSGPDVYIYDSKFDQNSAGQGGAVSSNNAGTLNLFFVLFSNNVALAWGGAIYFQQAYGSFQNSTLYGNSAQQGGGASAMWNEAEVYVVSTNITQNTSPRGGAFYLQYSSTLQVVSSSIQYNTADENGGGVYCSDSDVYLNDTTSLDNNQASSTSSTDLYCAEDIPYTYCRVHGATNFTCSMPDEGGPSNKEYNTLIIISSVLVGSAVLIGCGSFIIYFLDADHRKQQGFYFSAFKEEEDDATPLPE